MNRNLTGCVLMVAAISFAVVCWPLGADDQKKQPPPSASPAQPKERTTLKGHKGIGSLAFSPDGKTLATAGEGGVKLWDPQSGNVKLSIEAYGKTGSVRQVAFSPDGKTLATSSNEDVVKLFDAATGKEHKSLEGSRGSAALAFSPDGNSLATTVGQWDLDTGKLRGTVRAQFAVAYSPDGKTLALGDNGLSLCDAATGKELRKIGQDGRGFSSVAFGPDGKALASLGFTSKVQLWDPATGNELARLEDAEKFEPHDFQASLAISADGRILAVGAVSDGVWLWNLTTQKKIGVLEDASVPVAFSRDRKTLATGGKDGAILLWDLPADK